MQTEAVSNLESRPRSGHRGIHMKSKFITILTVATVTLGTSVQAQEATPDTWITEARSTLSRASVLADLQSARLSGLFDAISAPVWSFEPMRRGTVAVRTVNGSEDSSRPIALSRAQV